MSIKTLRKRIALVAVSALGVGLLSVAPASATSGATPVDGASTILGTSSLCYASNDAGTALTLPSTAADELTSGNDGVNVIMPVGGSLLIGVHAADNVFLTGPLSVTSFDNDGTATGGGAEATAQILLNADGERYIDNGTANNDIVLQASQTGSATIVTMASGTTRTSTRANTINVTIVDSCTNTTLSESYTVSQSTSLTCITAGNVTRGADITTFAAGDPACITAVVKNAYNAVVPSGTMSVTATNGALVNMDGSTISLATSDTEGTTSFDTAATTDGTDVFVRVDNPTGAALTTVVTIAYNGQTVATKTLTWRGEATKINVVAKSIGKVSGKGQIHYTLTDAAGNLTAGNVTGLVTSFGAQITSTTNSTNTGTDTQPTAATAGKPASLSAVAPVATDMNGVALLSVIPTASYGILVFNCGATSGKGTITIRHYQPVTGAYISTPVELSCAGGVDTYSVSADKASYKVGEVATFTITAKDSSGNPVHDYLSTNNAALLSGTAADVSIGGGTITKATANSDAIGILASQASGTAVYKAQLTTAGSFNAVINLAGSTTKSITVPYTVTSGEVSNAEVLAAIVKLIASINKQIKALQKSLKK